MTGGVTQTDEGGFPCAREPRCCTRSTSRSSSRTSRCWSRARTRCWSGGRRTASATATITSSPGTIPIPCPSSSVTRRRASSRGSARAVETVKPGDHVCSSYIPSCGKCWYCINGQPTLCALRDRPRWFMMDGTPSLPAERSAAPPLPPGLGLRHPRRAPEESVIPVRKDAPLDVVCLVSCGVLAGRRPRLQSRPRPARRQRRRLGLRRRRAQHDPGRAPGRRRADHRRGRDAQKLAWAEEFGATHVVDASKEDPVARVQALSGTGGVDFAFEVVGTQKTIEQALLAHARGGTCVVVGVCPAGTRCPSIRCSSSSSATSPAARSAPGTSAPTSRC